MGDRKFFKRFVDGLEVGLKFLTKYHKNFMPNRPNLFCCPGSDRQYSGKVNPSQPPSKNAKQSLLSSGLQFSSCSLLLDPEAYCPDTVDLLEDEEAR